MPHSLQHHGLQLARILSSTISQSLFKFISIESVMLIKTSHPLPPPSHFAFNLSQHQHLFQWVGSLHWVPKYWRFSYSNSTSNEYSGLISFMMDSFDLLAVQVTLKSLLQHQHHNWEASILPHSTFFMVKRSHPNMTTGKTIALTIWTFVGRVRSLLFIYLFIFNMLSRLVIVFLARTSLVAQRVKRLPPMRETWVRSLGREDTLEKEMAIHSSTIPWKIPWTEEPGRLQSMGSQRVRPDWVTFLYFSFPFLAKSRHL